MLRKFRRAVEESATQVREDVSDLAHNLRSRGVARRILVLRQRDVSRTYTAPFLRWVAREAPWAWSRMELRTLPSILGQPSLDGVALLAPWLQDPLRERFPRTFERATILEARCRARGIPVMQPVASLSISIKSRASARLRAAGLRMPEMVRLDGARLEEAAERLGYPFFVREDERHGGPMHLVESRAALSTIPVATLHKPVAVEYIDTQSPDGLYRKWRYVCVGERGVPRHMIASRSWIVHAMDRVLSEETLAEERAYVEGSDPHHAELQRAREALGLDYVAFDYSLDRHGGLVIWEPNPFPVLWAPFNETRADLQYQRPTIRRVYQVLLSEIMERADRHG